MEKIISKIKEFHSVFGIEESKEFGYVDPKRDALHYDLLIEEVEEFREACENQNEEKIIDGIGDVIFVAISSAIERGMGDILVDVIMEISRANISKKGSTKGENIYREDGKVLRSPNYTPPDIKSIIKKYKERLVCDSCGIAICSMKRNGSASPESLVHCPLSK